MDVVQWSRIEAECDGYRAGFVATFRKYEGQKTDEKDAAGRGVKVTSGSFARHMGIAFNTFKSWIQEDQDRGRRNRATEPGVTRSGQMGRQIAKSPAVTIDDKVGMLEDLTSDPKVLKAFREKQTPVVSEADAKAATAVVDAFANKVNQAATGLEVPMWIDQLKKITTELATYEFDEDTIKKLSRATRKLMDEIEIQEFRLGLIEEVN